MIRFVLGGLVLALSLLTTATASDTGLDVRSLPMHFEMRREGPTQVCGKDCRTWVSATGAITADTPRDFEAFARGRDLRGALIALDSDGGSVLGALALGRTIRRLGMSTTVGKTIDVPTSDTKEKRAVLNPRAYCGSMCTFVLLAGVERYVPAEAHVLVHQIWLGDRRDDPTAATYSAEDLVLVQRDIGHIAHYTVEMSGSVDLLSVMLKIPPWEPMYELSRKQLRDMKLASADDAATARKLLMVRAGSPIANRTRVASNGRGWAMVEKGGPVALARRHPLTVYGEDIGSFDLTLQCGTAADHFIMTYAETRTSDKAAAPKSLRDVELRFGSKTVALKIVSSQTNGQSIGRESLASGPVPAGLIKHFAAPIKQTVTIETASSDDSSTIITIGNAGLSRHFARLVSSCSNPPQQRSVSAESSEVVTVRADNPHSRGQ